MADARPRLSLLLVTLAGVFPPAWAQPASTTICGDTDRDGQVTAADQAGRASWTRERGALFLANLDDDDRDGKRDAFDTRVNGAADARDLAPLEVQAPAGARLRVEAGGTPVHLFEQTATGWRYVDLRAGGALSAPGGRVRLGVEAWELVGQSRWDGAVTLRVTATLPDGRPAGSDAVRLRVAPWLMLPNSARTTELYLATERYDNARMLEQLRLLLPRFEARLVLWPTDRWQEMWMQDALELGYTQMPGASMHVVLLGLREQGRFGATLLGPDVGTVQVGAPRALSGQDAWSDWMGNLEVTGPAPGHPLGRIYYGRNVDTGQGLHPAVVRFLEAQGAQAPFWVDTSWLAIKHVDEIFNVYPGRGGKQALVIASPAEGARLVPGGDDAYNRGLQARLDTILEGGTYVIAGRTEAYPGLRRLLALEPGQVVRLPVLYDPQSLAGWTAPGAHNRWSNPVNSVFVNRGALVGGTGMPAAVRDEVAARLRGAGASEVHFLDDAVYQRNWGNVHCATNTRRVPPVARWWEAR